jgi:hypothetical protein
MNITSHELKTMKVKQLRKIIREAITEVLAEAPQKTTIDYKNSSQPDKVLDIEPSDTVTINKLKSDSSVGSVTMGNRKIKEGELAEMAMGNKLSDENMDLSPFANQMLSGNSLKDILTYIKENPGATEKQIAAKFKFQDKNGNIKQQPINALMSILRKKMIPKLDKDGNPIKDENGNIVQVPIITRLDKGGEVIVPKAPGEEGEEDEEPVTGVDALFIGKGDSLAQFFDNEPNADGSEDFTDEEPKDIEKAEPARPTDARSKAAEFTTDDRNSRLIQKIINLYSTSKTRVKEAADREGGELSSRDVSIAAKKSKESAENQLPELIKQLADRIKTEEPEVQKAILDLLAKRFASVNYASLSKKLAKEIGIEVKEPVVSKEEPEEEEEDTIDEAFNREYELRKLQFYAGIRK